MNDLLLGKNAEAAEEFNADRRGFIKHGLMFSAALGFWTPELAMASAAAAPSAREVFFHNAHTGEKFKGAYWENGKYLSDAFGELRRVMRDFRTGDEYPIDPRLIDVLYVLKEKVENKNPYSLFSAYRSPKTNNMLLKRSEGVARNSLHMQGQAADINLPGTRLSSLEKSALKLKIGGVGYYAKSGFVHIDTGKVRSW